jgi:hypothetical protein
VPRNVSTIATVSRNIDQVAKAFGLTRIPELVEIYDERFLRRARSASTELATTGSTAMSSEPIPHGTTLIVRGGRAMLPGGNWHEPEVRDIAIAGDTIVRVAESFAPAAGASIEELDARGHLVLPGFVNAHYTRTTCWPKARWRKSRSRPGGFTRCRRNIRPAP